MQHTAYTIVSIRTLVFSRITKEELLDTIHSLEDFRYNALKEFNSAYCNKFSDEECTRISEDKDVFGIVDALGKNAFENFYFRFYAIDENGKQWLLDEYASLRLDDYKFNFDNDTVIFR